MTDSSCIVSFTATFKLNSGSKDGYYVDDYVVSINPEFARKLDGKKIKVTGRYQVINGLENIQHDKEREIIHEQGRLEETRHILTPEIEIVEE